MCSRGYATPSKAPSGPTERIYVGNLDEASDEALTELARNFKGLINLHDCE